MNILMKAKLAVASTLATVSALGKGGARRVNNIKLYVWYVWNIEEANMPFSEVPRRHKKGVREQLRVGGLSELEFMTLEELKERRKNLENGEK